MKARLIYLPIFFAIQFLFSSNIVAQGYINGPEEACIGECSTYLLDTIPFPGPNDFVFWSINGPNGSTFFEQEYPLTYCWEFSGFYNIIAEYSIDGISGVSEIGVFVNEGFIGEIVSDSSCPDPNNSGTPEACEQACAFSTVTYSIPGSNADIEWDITGSDNYTVNGNSVTVEWGEPGTGLIEASASNNTPLSLYCNSTQTCGIAGCFPFAYVDVNGGTAPYSYQWDDPTGGNMNAIEADFFSTYTVTVTDANGQTETCTVFVEEQQCILPAVFSDIKDASTCDVCDGQIIISDFNWTGADYTYYWSDGSTALSREGLCPGTYVLYIDSWQECTLERVFVVGCEQGFCGGDLSLCVEILEEPEAAFSTTPPLENGVLNICEGQTVYFANESTNAENFTWDFGPGQSFNDVNSFYTYTTAGTYQVSLIAANACFCADTATLTVIVEDAIGPQVDCIGTICEGEIITYTSSDDCGIFNWIVSGNGTVTGGGGTTDDFVTIEWGAGPIGTIELAVDNCSGDYCSEPTIAQIPIISDNAEIEGPDRVCNLQTATYSVPLYSGTEYFWSVTNRGTIESGLNTNEITVKWESNSIPVTGQYITVEFMNCYLGCGGQDTLYIDLLPEYYLGGPIEACENEVTEFGAFNAVTQAATVNANWTVYAPDGSIAQTSSSPSAIFGATWTAGTGEYRVEIQADDIQNYCTDSYEIKVDVIAPPPAVSAIDGAKEICPGQPYAYIATTATPANSFRWLINNGGTITEIMGNPITVVWGNTGPYELTVSEISVTGPACESSPYTVNLSTIQNVSITETADACRDEVAIYNATGFADVNYDWSIVPADAGTIVEGQNTTAPTVLWHQAGNFDVQLDICGLTEIFTVEVHDKPNPTVIYPTALCANETATIETSTLFTTYSWRNEAGAEVSTDPDPSLFPGYYELVVTDNFGCEEDTTFFIDPYPVPTINISTPDKTWYCPGGQAPTLFAVDTDEGYTYQWLLDNAPIGGNTSSILADQFGFYRVQVTDQNGCMEISNSIYVRNYCDGPPCTDSTCPPTVFCLPGVDISFVKNYPTPICNERSYTNTSSNYVAGSLYWSFDDPDSGMNFSTDENPTHIYSQAGFFEVILRGQTVDASNPPATIACLDHVIDTVLMAADFDVENACPGSVTNFTDLSTFLPDFTSIASWSWDFGDPASGSANTSIDQHPTHVFNADGNYTVTLTAIDASGCISIKTKEITVNPIPTVDFPDPIVSCQATAMNFIVGGSSNITSVEWDFGDPTSGAANTSTLEDTYHAFASPGNYTVTLFATNIYGCSNAFSKVITVEPNTLTGNISLSQPSPLCEGESTTLTAPSGGISWLWSTNETTESITVSTEEVYTITITNTEGCSYVPQPVVIDILPAPDGTIRAVEYDDFGQPINLVYDAYEVCEGEDVFMEIIEVTNYSYEWTGNETGNTLEFSDNRGNLLSQGNYDFYVTITDNTTGCTSVTQPFTVTVHGLPADFTISASETGPICANTSTTFTVNSPDPNLTYLWSNGEIGTSITSSEAGEYFATAINSFGCEKESNKVAILPGPNINRIPAGCHTRCNPDTICLPPMAGVVAYQWYLNGTLIPAPEGTIRDLIATESGTYQLEMTDNLGCIVLSDPLTLDLYDGYGNINGDVYSDVNHNGIIDAADTLLMDITIVLNDGTNTVETVTSNVNGAYFFNNILSTDYSLFVDTVLLGTENKVVGDNPVDISLVGCDVEEELDWLIDLDCSSTPSSLSLNTCGGTPVAYNGMMISPGAPVNVVLTNSTGCDSTVMVQVFDNPTHNLTETIQSCAGSSIIYDGVNILAGANQDFTYTNQYGCDSTVMVNVIANPMVQQTINLAACDGDFQVYDGVNILAGSQQNFNYTTTNGCDSTITVIVAMNPLETSIENYSACEGSNYMYDGVAILAGAQQDFTYTNQNGCDSTVTVMVAMNPLETSVENYSACQGSNYMYDGVAILAGAQQDFTYTNQNGCDSTVTVMVAMNPLETSVENYSACEGSNYMYDGVAILAGAQQDFTYTNQNGCDSTVTVMVAMNPLETSVENYSACEGSNYMYDGVAILAGAQQDFTYTNQNGCDSTVTVMVAMNPLETSVENYSACEGSNYMYDGVAILAGAQQDFTYTNQNGCDSTVTVMIAINPHESSIENLTACEGSSIMYDGVAVAAGTQQDFTLVNQNGCDSTVTVIVASNSIVNTTETLEACAGESANYNGQFILAGDSEDFTYTGVTGCDSIVTVNVTANPLEQSSLTLDACQGNTVMYNGLVLNAGTTQDIVLQNQFFCDSTVSVTVIENQIYNELETLEACQGSSITYDGIAIPAGTQEVFNYSSVNGCDSTVTVAVMELQIHVMTENYSACEGSNYIYDGVSILAGAQQDFTYTNQNGCDSTVTVMVGVNPIETSVENYSACEGSDYIYDGVSILAGAQQDFTYTNQNGCDSTVTVMVGVNPIETSIENYSACAGSNYIYDGVSILAGGQQDFTYTNQNGCDSTVTVMVAENPLETSIENLSACAGSSIMYDGIAVAAGTQQDFTLVNQNGCDSTVTVIVASNSIVNTTETLEACVGESANYNGQFILAGDSEDFTYTGVTGCDSIVTVNVTANPLEQSSLTLGACQGSTVMYNGLALSAGTTQDVVLQNQSSCDSTVSVTVIENQIYNELETMEACQGSSITYDGIAIPAGAQEIFNYSSVNGCDSTVTVEVMELQINVMTENYTACEGSDYIYDGVAILAGAQQDFTYTNQNGCDSTVTVLVGVNPIESSVENYTACEGSDYIYDGVSILAGGQQDFTYTNQNGCDSIVTVMVGVNPIETSVENYSACEGSNYIYDGVSILAGAQQDFTYMNQNGCDSTVTVMVGVNPIETSVENYSACEGSNYIYDGVSILAGGQQDFTYTNQNGCDSTVTVLVGVNPIETSVESYSACEGSNYIYDGVAILAGGQQDFTYTNQNGCDSTVTVMIALNPLENLIESYSACEGSNYMYDGVAIPAGSQQDFTYTNQLGCDSTVTVMVEEKIASQSVAVLETCLGSTASYNGEDLPVGTLQTYTFTNQFGCDSIVEVSVLSYTDFDFILEANEVCRNTWEGEINVVEMAGGTPPFLYQIVGLPQQESTRFTNLQAGIYNVAIEDGNGCIHEDQVEVAAFESIVVEMDDSELPCEMEGVLLTPQVSGNTDGLSFVWQDGSTEPTFFAEEPGNYWVEASNICGAQKTEASVEMEVEGQTSFLYIPNAFSPNRDAVNDKFQAFCSLSVDVKDYQLEVFDRWGNKVYTTTNVHDGWDGKKGGRYLNPGVFIYQVNATIQSCGRTVEVFESGDVTLLR